jgi:hypothetical protein
MALRASRHEEFPIERTEVFAVGVVRCVPPDRERDVRGGWRRWINLISAGWVPHFIGPSRGCLDLVAGIIARMPT